MKSFVGLGARYSHCKAASKPRTFMDSSLSTGSMLRFNLGELLLFALLFSITTTGLNLCERNS